MVAREAPTFKVRVQILKLLPRQISLMVKQKFRKLPLLVRF